MVIKHSPKLLYCSWAWRHQFRSRKQNHPSHEYVPVETLIFEDEGHSFTKLENRIEAYTAIAAFLDEHV